MMDKALSFEEYNKEYGELIKKIENAKQRIIKETGIPEDKEFIADSLLMMFSAFQMFGKGEFKELPSEITDSYEINKVNKAYEIFIEEISKGELQ